MRIAIASITGTAPYCQSRFHETPKNNKEGSDDYERRTWRNRLHVNDEGEVFIPALAPKNAIAEAAKYLSIQIPGKGKSTYTKHFESGVVVFEDASLGIQAAGDRVTEKRMFVPSTGIRGDGKRVMKSYPVILPPWRTQIQFVINDDVITSDVFKLVLRQAGQLIGLGSFRVRNNGIFGTFKVDDIQWEEIDLLG